MNAVELCELDAWIAESLFGFKVDKSAMVYYNADTRDNIPDYSADPAAFALVKCEIERRGWDWQCSRKKLRSDGPFNFVVTEAIDSHVSLLGYATSESEELSGCLAVKAAIEGMA